MGDRDEMTVIVELSSQGISKPPIPGARKKISRHCEESKVTRAPSAIEEDWVNSGRVKFFTAARLSRNSTA